MILTQCARQGGLLAGPAVFALVSVIVKQGQPVAPASLLAWVIFAQVVFGFLMSFQRCWCCLCVLSWIESRVDGI